MEEQGEEEEGEEGKRGRGKEEEEGEEGEEKKRILTANTLCKSNCQAEQSPSVKELSTVGKIWPNHHQGFNGK